MRNVLGKVPEHSQAEVKAAVQAAYYAPNQEVAEIVAADLLAPGGQLYPAAMKSIGDDLEAR
jgi:transposase-like protein